MSTDPKGRREEPQELSEDELKKGGKARYAADTMPTEATRLMIATKNGDPEAFGLLVTRLRSRAFHIARSLVGSREDAMDLSQETFMKIFRARDTFREGDPFLPWFHRILRNTCFSFLRKNGRLRKRSLSAMGSIDDDSPDYDLVDESPGPEAIVREAERKQLFQEGLARLSSRDREILTLRHFKHLSYKEIADSLGIPQGTVMSRLFHARRRLRELLADKLLELPDPAAPKTQGGAA